MKINHLIPAIPVSAVYFVTTTKHGLTTGQASATTRKGFAMNGSPDGCVCSSMNICEFVLSLAPHFLLPEGFSGGQPATGILQNAPDIPDLPLSKLCKSAQHTIKATKQEWFWDRIPLSIPTEKYLT